MNEMHRRLAIVLTATLVSGAASVPLSALGQDRVEGTVVRVKLTFCHFKPRGCAGWFLLAHKRPDKTGQVTIDVSFETQIRQGDDYIYLSALGGKKVAVTYVTKKGAIHAKSIEVLEPQVEVPEPEEVSDGSYEGR